MTLDTHDTLDLANGIIRRNARVLKRLAYLHALDGDGTPDPLDECPFCAAAPLRPTLFDPAWAYPCGTTVLKGTRWQPKQAPECRKLARSRIVHLRRQIAAVAEARDQCLLRGHEAWKRGDARRERHEARFVGRLTLLHGAVLDELFYLRHFAEALARRMA